MNEIKNLKKEKLNIKTKEETTKFVNELMSTMTLREKIGQMYQSGHNSTPVTGPVFDSSDTVKNIKAGIVGSVIGINDPYLIYSLQKEAVNNSPHHIPLLFCNDIIHGCNTAFPINLAMSCSFNPSLVEESARCIAKETSHSGINLTFSPMLDIVRDPRWGRVMESNGDDVYLGSVLAASYVKGYQQEFSNPNSIMACAKHFLGYGAALAEREYNSVELSDRTVKNTYLPPFSSAVNEGCAMVMTSFNTLNDVPMTCNKKYLRGVLRDELKFEGVTISDFTSTKELIEHRVAKNERDVAKKSILAGLNHEMISRSYIDYLEDLVFSGEVSESLIDEACFNVLRLKYIYGLFDDPYRNIYYNYNDYLLTQDVLDTSLKMAEESIVLLKNENNILPLNKDSKHVFFSQKFFDKNLIGCWRGKARDEDCMSMFEVASKLGYPLKYVSDEDGYKYSFEEYDTVVLAVGENSDDSGEAKSLTNLELSAKDKEKILHFKDKNVKIILIVFSGRPLVLTDIIGDVSAIIYAWQLGTEAATALLKTIYGQNNPSGKLTMTFPRNIGQIPVFYNSLPTGRPYSKEVDYDFYRSKYLDSSNDPLFKFGFGLSYSKFSYSKLHASTSILDDNSSIEVSVEVTNDSEYFGKEIVQLYIRANCFSVSRPNYELKRFSKISLEPHETKKVVFVMKKTDFAYYNIDMENIAEPSTYKIFVGPNLDSLEDLEITIK